MLLQVVPEAVDVEPERCGVAEQVRGTFDRDKHPCKQRSTLHVFGYTGRLILIVSRENTSSAHSSVRANVLDIATVLDACQRWSRSRSMRSTRPG
ncbi:MAG TPA: hypothetical protein VKB75_17385, partial [Jatrophihabitans sp.]|nr:hypothetical protein [Jatrophihabitans sp.]